MDKRKQAVKMTRLSCHRFRANEVRLWLSLIAYNLGNLWRRLALPARIGNWSTDQHAAAVGENRRAFEARPALLAAPGGESLHTAAVHRHTEENHRATGAGGIAAVVRLRTKSP
jgi:hypothetical protein